MYVLNGKTIRLGRPFSDSNGIQYPANFIQCASQDDLDRVGITIEPDPEPAPKSEPPEHSKAQQRLDIADNKMPRMVDDLIDILIANGVMSESDMPQIMLDTYNQKKADRAIIAQAISDGILRVL